jgi:Fe-S oxidoreductase
MLDLHVPAEVGVMKQIADEAYELVVKYKGSLSGEHGDGLVRSHFNEAFFGPQVYGAFMRLKSLFDPGHLMNPGKVVDAPPMDQNLRYDGAHYRTQPVIETLFHYRQDSGFRKAVEQCTGVGACRKTLNGTMCPSYIATRDEEHSTRGRANALRLAMTGQLGPDALASERLREVLDLCISCKGCRGECPNGVDMAKLKAEVMQKYHEEHGTALRDRLFRDFPKTARLASGPLAPLANAVMKAAPIKVALDRFAGIDKRRVMPAYAHERLSTWFQRRSRNGATAGQGSAKRQKVALFNDTYIEHNEPHVGRAAVEVLEAAGYEVELVSAGCCQRPALSKGFVAEAKRGGTQTFLNLDSYARAGIPILVCEPSCASSLTDDLPDLIDDEELGKRVSSMVKPIDQFLAEELAAGRCNLPFKKGVNGEIATGAREILFHGHCHQKSLFGTGPARALLGRIPGAAVKEIDSGCCGMAGSFGYEKEHYELSMKIGEDRLFPALREAKEGTLVVACGFSCRHQIADGVGMKARHVIELIREALDR